MYRGQPPHGKLFALTQPYLQSCQRGLFDGILLSEMRFHSASKELRIGGKFKYDLDVIVRKDEGKSGLRAKERVALRLRGQPQSHFMVAVGNPEGKCIVVPQVRDQLIHVVTRYLDHLRSPTLSCSVPMPASSLRCTESSKAGERVVCPGFVCLIMVPSKILVPPEAR